MWKVKPAFRLWKNVIQWAIDRIGHLSNSQVYVCMWWSRRWVVYVFLSPSCSLSASSCPSSSSSWASSCTSSSPSCLGLILHSSCPPFIWCILWPSWVKYSYVPVSAWSNWSHFSPVRYTFLITKTRTCLVVNEYTSFISTDIKG